MRFRALLVALLLVALAPLVSAQSGEEFYDEVIKETPIYDDPQLQAYIRELGENIVAQSELAGEKFTFTLLDSPTINAFATKDNYVYIYRGLLSLMSNEAQLVSVLAHEVAHVTQKHVEGQQGSATGAQILSTIAAILTNSSEVYEAGLAYANSIIRGHGREDELEADSVGAGYMARLGYDTQEMLAMMSAMKDNEQLQKARAKGKGAPRQTYHGVFSTHPRNDARLRTLVTNAGRRNSAVSALDSGAARYRQMTDGLLWGENFAAKEKSPQRYSNSKLRVRFDYPEGWSVIRDDSKHSASGSAADNAATLAMASGQRSLQNPEEFLYNHLGVAQLKESQSISPARLKGFTGVLPGGDGKSDQRIAVIYYKYNAFLFTGTVSDGDKFAEFDKQFLDTINTFRPITQREIDGQKPKKMHYVKATSATRFDALIKQFHLNKEDGEELRLINGYYPDGEPRAGEWIKIIRQ